MNERVVLAEQIHEDNKTKLAELRKKAERLKDADDRCRCFILLDKVERDLKKTETKP